MEQSQSTYLLPGSYIAFCAELEEACQKGDADSKEIIETLVPLMAVVLKLEKQDKQWTKPDVPLDDIPPGINIITSLNQVKPSRPSFIAATIAQEHGAVTSVETPATNSPQEDECNQALTNFLVDVAVIPDTVVDHPPSASKDKVANSQGAEVRVKTLLKGFERSSATKRSAQQRQGKKICSWRAGWR